MKKALFLFGELNDDDLDWIIERGQIEKIPKDTIMIVEGEPIDSLYILLKGKLEVLLTDNNENYPIAYLESGEVFGEISFIDNRLPSATVKTIENSLVLSIPRFQLETRLHQDVGFCSRFYRSIALFLSSRLRNTLKKSASPRQDSVKEEIDFEDLPPTFLESLPCAEARFDWLLRRVKNIIS